MGVTLTFLRILFHRLLFNPLSRYIRLWRVAVRALNFTCREGEGNFGEGTWLLVMGRKLPRFSHCVKFSSYARVEDAKVIQRI